MRRIAVWGMVVVSVTAACGDSAQHVDTVKISQPKSTGGDPKIAGAALTDFGAELFAAVRDDANAVISPVSVAVAMSMLEPGASGDAKAQIDRALRVTDASAYHASMTALRSSLEAAKPPPKNPDSDPGDLEISVANATYMQRGYRFRPAYLSALGEFYGPVLKTVDFAGHRRDAVRDINAFVEHATRGHLKDVLKDVDPATVLALANALYLKASWATPFDKEHTARESFTRLDGSATDTDLMHGTSNASQRGDGWVGARKLYSARLAAEFVLPDVGHFDDVAGRLGAAFAQLGTNPGGSATLVVPKFTTRMTKELKPAFTAMGISAPYVPGNLLGIADDDSVVLDQAVHATFLAMDEEGTEAAAATILTFTAVGAPLVPPVAVPVILDRPFFFRILDLETGATLFVGQVLDPTAG